MERYRLILSAYLMASPAAAAVLSGSIVENLTSRPLARARVTVEPRGPATSRSSQSAWTRASGQFSFESLPAGAYTLRAEKAGYALVSYGQRRPGEPGTSIVLQAESHFTAELRLPRLGAVTGEVLDENQVGLPGLPVYAFEAGDRLKAAAVTQSDDRGVYRLAGLKPGRYVIRTGPARLEDATELVPTYHPQSPSLMQAARIEIRLDREATAVNIAPRAGHLASIEGRVIGGGADTVTLLGDTGRHDTRLQPGGSFRFDQIEPGPYTLVAESLSKDRSAMAEVAAGTEDSYVLLEMRPAGTLVVNCVSTDGSRVNAGAIPVFLRRSELGGNSARISCGETVRPGPGRWHFGVLSPPEFYLASISDTSRGLDRNGGDDAHEFLLKPAEHREITVLLGSKPASLSGKVGTADGAVAAGVMVYLKASTSELSRRLGGARSVRADEAGIYRFVGLPPGGYELMASYQARGLGEEEGAGGSGVPIRLEEGQQGSLDLRVTTID
jgi:protocatechuate 3,4-dioxygenase beta subunit